ncbi:hypothetical protein H696_04799 [Fonticula alba]|uniref:Uncharacterized protein n=1 Tax=Fonticula alba TaxID=691883 RepID=A0A058Z4U2_FONAL|nr:hypothetical protein H696_04799 [Fonticula alba]KCV68507.1 hypothetical protein H696_04799 [Fonticula alba]|eukprot:XP_009496939.1 hypothetical protein H696_04799 [Fonticula alba]
MPPRPGPAPEGSVKIRHIDMSPATQPPQASEPDAPEVCPHLSRAVKPNPAKRQIPHIKVFACQEPDCSASASDQGGDIWVCCGCAALLCAEHQAQHVQPPGHVIFLRTEARALVVLDAACARRLLRALEPRDGLPSVRFAFAPLCFALHTRPDAIALRRESLHWLVRMAPRIGRALLADGDPLPGTPGFGPEHAAFAACFGPLFQCLDHDTLSVSACGVLIHVARPWHASAWRTRKARQLYDRRGRPRAMAPLVQLLESWSTNMRLGAAGVALHLGGGPVAATATASLVSPSSHSITTSSGGAIAHVDSLHLQRARLAHALSALTLHDEPRQPGAATTIGLSDLSSALHTPSDPPPNSFTRSLTATVDSASLHAFVQAIDDPFWLPAISDFLSTWDGCRLRHSVFRLISLCPPMAFEEIYTFILNPLLHLFQSSDTVWKCTLINMYSTLTSRWCAVFMAEESMGLGADRYFGLLATIRLLAAHVDRLCLHSIISERAHPLVETTVRGYFLRLFQALEGHDSSKYSALEEGPSGLDDSLDPSNILLGFSPRSLVLLSANPSSGIGPLDLSLLGGRG